MNTTSYLQVRAKIESEYRRQLRSLDDLWGLVNKGKAPPQPICCHDAAVEAIRGGWQRVARQVIDEMDDGTEFIVSDIAKELILRNPLLEPNNTYVSGYLKKLADRNQLTIVEAGSGRRATIYKKE